MTTSVTFLCFLEYFNVLILHLGHITMSPFNILSGKCNIARADRPIALSLTTNEIKGTHEHSSCMIGQQRFSDLTVLILKRNLDLLRSTHHALTVGVARTLLPTKSVRSP